MNHSTHFAHDGHEGACCSSTPAGASTIARAEAGKSGCCGSRAGTPQEESTSHACCHDDGSAKAATACCSTGAGPASIAGHTHHAGHGGSSAALASAATLHCLTGCVIGEFVGLSIGVSLGLSAGATIALATTLSYISGFSLGLWPLLRRGMGFTRALRTIWLGEAISIGVMELAMNFADYHMGGMAASSILDSQFWLGLAVAVPAGYIAAWPVNWWLLDRSIKQPCH